MKFRTPARVFRRDSFDARRPPIPCSLSQPLHTVCNAVQPSHASRAQETHRLSSRSWDIRL
eukprot:1264912-Amphidinium_carterae.1